MGGQVHGYMGSEYMEGWAHGQISTRAWICFVLTPAINPVSISHCLLKAPNSKPKINCLSFKITSFSDRDKNFGIICSILLFFK